MASWRYSSKYGRLVPLTKAGLQKLQATGSLEIPGTPRTKSSKGWSRKRDFNEVDLADSNHSKDLPPQPGGEPSGSPSLPADLHVGDGRVSS